jgi:spore maturation protein CgeB
MNILYYFAETNAYMQQWQRFHLLDELQRAGHTVTVYNPLSFASIDEANERLSETIRMARQPFDLFMNCTPSRLLYKESMQQLKKLGIPSLLICFDNLHAPFIHKEIAPFFDLVWLTSYETQYLFDQWKCHSLFLPYAANPYLFKPDFGEELLSVGFIGTLYDDRVIRVNRLTEHQIPCTLYSDGFFAKENASLGKLLTYKETVRQMMNLSTFSIGRKVAYGTVKNKWFPEVKQLHRNDFLALKHSVPFEQMNAVYSNHALSLGISELRNTFVLKHPVHKIHLRTFEIPMCGGLQIAPYRDEVAGYFEEDKEIILCRDDEEFYSKAAFYLKPENARLRRIMKENARKRAEADHTWGQRFNAVFSALFQ